MTAPTVELRRMVPLHRAIQPKKSYPSNTPQLPIPGIKFTEEELMKLRSTRSILSLVLIATAFSSAWLAQSQNGAISGTITDEAKNFIPGVTVTAVNAQGERRSTAISNENGNYTLGGLPPGTYTVTAVLPGFETATSSGIALASQGQSAQVDFTLRIARQRGGVMPLPPPGPRDRDVAIRADSMTARGSTVLYKGNVEMATESVIMRADELDFNWATQQADARGNVRVQVLPITVRVRPLAD